MACLVGEFFGGFRCDGFSGCVVAVWIVGGVKVFEWFACDFGVQHIVLYRWVVGLWVCWVVLGCCGCCVLGGVVSLWCGALCCWAVHLQCLDLVLGPGLLDY